MAIIRGTNGDDFLEGTPGADVISGLGGDDVIAPQRGDDVVRGGDGGDFLNNGEGEDNFDGGSGSDTVAITFNETRDGRVDLAAGRSRFGDDVEPLRSIESYFSGDGDDLLLGTNGVNALLGGGGNDRIEGRYAADLVVGNEGDDLLLGGAGSDELDGGAGDDRATGGDGADLFEFGFTIFGNFQLGSDTITDFRRGQGDKIDAALTPSSDGFIANPFDRFDTNDNGRIDDADGGSRVGGLRLDSSVEGSTVLSFEVVEGDAAGDTLDVTVARVTDLRASDFVFD